MKEIVGVIHRTDRELIKMRHGLRGFVVSGWITFEQPKTTEERPMADSTNTSLLLGPFDLRALSLKNRVVMAPMTRSRAGKERLPNSLMAEYYAQRASAGLIITEATVISVQAIGWLNSPGIYSDEQAEAWKMVADAVHAKGAPIFLQLWHCGRASHSSFHENEGLPVAPSAAKIDK